LFVVVNEAERDKLMKLWMGGGAGVAPPEWVDRQTSQ